MSKQDVKNKILKQSINNSNNTEQRVFGVMLGRIDDDGQEMVLLKKVFKDYQNAIDYTNNFVKTYITERCGANFYSNHSNDCLSVADVEMEDRQDGYYLIKNNNSWSIYHVYTEIKPGYLGTYAKKCNKHILNLYIAREGSSLTTLTPEFVEHDELVSELKLKFTN